jgi:hypothetical protein
MLEVLAVGDKVAAVREPLGKVMRVLQMAMLVILVAQAAELVQRQ